jgi:hypothetical protein
MVKEFQSSDFRPGGATWAGLMKRSGMKESTYQRALDWCTDHQWFVGGGGRNLKYHLNPDGKWKAAFRSPLSPAVEAIEVKKSPSLEANWRLVRGDEKIDRHLALISEAIHDVDEKKH